MPARRDSGSRGDGELEAIEAVGSSIPRACKSPRWNIHDLAEVDRPLTGGRRAAVFGAVAESMFCGLWRTGGCSAFIDLWKPSQPDSIGACTKCGIELAAPRELFAANAMYFTKYIKNGAIRAHARTSIVGRPVWSKRPASRAVTCGKSDGYRLCRINVLAMC